MTHFKSHSELLAKNYEHKDSSTQNYNSMLYLKFQIWNEAKIFLFTIKIERWRHFAFLLIPNEHQLCDQVDDTKAHLPPTKKK